MNLKKMLAMTGTAALICAAAMAQDTGGGPGGDAPGGGRRGGGPGGGGFDRAQFQQRMMDNLRDEMGIKDDSEWKIVQERIQKVMDARRETMAGFGRGGRRGGGGDNNTGGQRRGGFGPQPSPELEALQKAIDSNAPTEQIKVALEKYRKAHAEKLAALEKAQASLKEVLSVKQEAVAVANGLLN